MKVLTNLDKKTLSDNNIELTKEIEDKLNDGYPLQYLVGNTNFYGYDFKVNEHVLIPRFETEQLIERTIKKVNFKINHALDICSGSGAIGITFSKELDIPVDLLEIFHEANAVCKENILINNANCKIIEKDLFNYQIEDKYELIISNPPYLTHEDDVDSNTRFEPNIALYSDDDSIKYYKYIIDQLPNLKNWKLISFEIGESQARKIIDYAKSKNIVNVYSEKDYNDKDRFIFIVKSE